MLNLFIFLFDSGGNKLYSKWFESADMVGSDSEVASAGKECWHVSNPSASAAATGTTAKGTVKFKAPVGSGLKLYAIANLDADMVRISSDLLSHNINSESDLLDFHIYLNQETVSRNGYFPMTGMREGITITTDNTSSINTATDPLRLRRLDAILTIGTCVTFWSLGLDTSVNTAYPPISVRSDIRRITIPAVSTILTIDAIFTVLAIGAILSINAIFAITVFPHSRTYPTNKHAIKS